MPCAKLHCTLNFKKKLLQKERNNGQEEYMHLKRHTKNIKSNKKLWEQACCTETGTVYRSNYKYVVGVTIDMGHH